MKREWMQKIQDSLCIVLNHLLFVAAAITVMDLFQAEQSYIWVWIVSVCIPFIIYHVIAKPPTLVPPAMFVIILGILSLTEKIMTKHDWSRYYYVILFVYLMGYFVYYFTKRFLDFLKLNQNTASNIPIQDIFQNGIGLTVLFSACSSVILILSANFDWFKNIMDRIWYVIQSFLRYILSGMETKPEPQGKPVAPEMGPGLGDVIPEELIPKQASEILKYMILLIAFFAAVMGVILAGYYIYYLIKDFEGFKRKKKHNEKLEKSDDVREFCGVEKKTRRKTEVFFFRSNREKIRKLYEKKILKKKKELVGEQEQSRLKYLTAKECCDRLSEQNLKTMYEKARYSEEHISSEDVRLAKG